VTTEVIEQKVKRGRPKLAPTVTITIRIPEEVMEIIQRRSAAAHMSPGIWLADRVIQNEVVRRHRKVKR